VEVRATITLRNEKMIRRRKELGLSQKDASFVAGVGISYLQAFEKFDYSIPKPIEKAEKIAAALDLEVSDVLPESLAGKTLESKKVAIKEIPPEKLLAPADKPGMLPPAEKAFQEDFKEAVGRLLHKLSFREREVLKLTYGLGGNDVKTLGYIAHLFLITKERVRQIQKKAIAKLQKPENSRHLQVYLPGYEGIIYKEGEE
jgi:RNA polymerase sigma factor (sigma-70 family)